MYLRKFIRLNTITNRFTSEKVMNRIKIGLIVFMLVFSSVNSSFAWGLTGHRVIGKIAENHINKKTKKAIDKILGNESIAMASNWADFIKSDSSFSYLNSWHYVNLNSGLNKSTVLLSLEKDTVANAYNRILFLREELKNNQKLNADTRVLYLKVLIHLIGDIHQPMHVGRGIDLGGNRVKIYWFNQSSNLHKLWDEQIIERQLLSYTEYAEMLDKTSRKERNDIQLVQPSEWVWESYIIANKLYESVESENRLGYRYDFDYIETLNQQLLKGGIRLAGILNEIFSK